MTPSQQGDFPPATPLHPLCLTFDPRRGAYSGVRCAVPADVFEEAVAGLVATGMEEAEARQFLLEETAWEDQPEFALGRAANTHRRPSGNAPASREATMEEPLSPTPATVGASDQRQGVGALVAPIAKALGLTCAAMLGILVLVVAVSIVLAIRSCQQNEQTLNRVERHYRQLTPMSCLRTRVGLRWVRFFSAT
jgi:hypothetical protein